MTVAKLVSKMTAAADSGLEEYVTPLYQRPGKTVLALVELKHIERTQPAPGSDLAPVVRLQINRMEVPKAGQSQPIQDALDALYLQRTAAGTLDQAGEVQLAEDTIRRTHGELHALEAARLHVGVRSWRARLMDVMSKDRMTPSDYRRDLREISNGLSALLRDHGMADIDVIE